MASSEISCGAEVVIIDVPVRYEVRKNATLQLPSLSDEGMNLSEKTGGLLKPLGFMPIEEQKDFRSFLSL
jgi:hypothetical protein